MIKRSIIISLEVYKELTLLAAKTDKFLYQLIEECIPLLKAKYEEHENE